MNYSFLKDIDKYIKENNLLQAGMYFSTRRLPYFYRQAIIEEMAKSNPDYKLDDQCQFVYDNNGNLVLLLTFNNMKTSLVITDSYGEFLEFPNSDFKFTKIKAETIYNKACYFELRNRKWKFFLEKIKEKDPSINDKSARQFAFELTEDYIKDVSENGSIVNFARPNEQLQSMASAVKYYANYLNELYLENQEYEKNQQKVIYFEQDEPEKDGPRRQKGQGNKIERKNEIIPSDERLDILQKLGPVYAIEAENKNNADRYFCLLYVVGNGEYKMVAEPKSGERYTKVIHFKPEEGMPVSSILENAILKYLSLSEKDFAQSSSTIRINHTSFDSFRSAISYAITLDSSEYKPAPYVKINAQTTDPDILEHQEKKNEQGPLL